MRAYKVVDVFTETPFKGNPVGVVLDAEDLSTERMQAIARWTNLSETTFLLPPSSAEADYRLRIFTPVSELPFAGHPTLGSAHAALEAGRVIGTGGVLRQECGVGLVSIRIEPTGRLAFGLPSAKLNDLDHDDIAELEAVLGRAVVRHAVPAKVDVGPVWIVAQMPSAEEVLALRPDMGRCAEFERRLGVTGISAFGRHSGSEGGIEVRSFAPSGGVDEDPVCGSGNGAVAVFQWRRGLLPADGASYVAFQGQRIGRDGRIGVVVNASGDVSVGGACVTCIDGALLV
ncbi:MAG TPA: PhzF family phenazine biosynthesis protein [Caulobacteraceae bacterium]|jgi:PhzF family phenazine biosynthesis protein